MKITACLSIMLVFYVVVIWQPKTEDSAQVYSENLVEENIYVEDEEIINNVYAEEDDINSNHGDNTLTIEFNEISDKLSRDEKNTINKILSKLSVTDCAKVNKILEMNNDESDKKALEFIKKRLLDEDYRQIEGILNQYLDLV